MKSAFLFIFSVGLCIGLNGQTPKVKMEDQWVYYYPKNSIDYKNITYLGDTMLVMVRVDADYIPYKGFYSRKYEEARKNLKNLEDTHATFLLLRTISLAHGGSSNANTGYSALAAAKEEARKYEELAYAESESGGTWTDERLVIFFVNLKNNTYAISEYVAYDLSGEAVGDIDNSRFLDWKKPVTDEAKALFNAATAIWYIDSLFPLMRNADDEFDLDRDDFVELMIANTSYMKHCHKQLLSKNGSKAVSRSVKKFAKSVGHGVWLPEEERGSLSY